MKPRRDRFGPVSFLVMAALLLFAFFGTPGVQAEVDTGPQLIALELVSHPAEADVLDAYCFESESLVDIDMKTTLVSPVQVTRYESGHRSGVVRSTTLITCFDDDLMLARPGAGAYPLRC